MQPDLLLRREEQLDARVRPRSSTSRRAASIIADDRGLVVGAEDRAAGVADDPVLDDRLDRRRRRDGVEVGAEEERRPPSAVGRDPAEEVPASSRSRAGVVLVDVEPERAELGGDAVGDRALLPGGLGIARELE